MAKRQTKCPSCGSTEVDLIEGEESSYVLCVQCGYDESEHSPSGRAAASW